MLHIEEKHEQFLSNSRPVKAMEGGRKRLSACCHACDAEDLVECRDPMQPFTADMLNQDQSLSGYELRNASSKPCLNAKFRCRQIWRGSSFLPSLARMDNAPEFVEEPSRKLENRYRGRDPDRMASTQVLVDHS